MRNLFGVGGLLVLGVGLLLTSCLDTPKFDNVPSIQYNNIVPYLIQDFNSLPNIVEADSIIITVDFEDGDGDLGVPSELRDTLNANYDLKTFQLNKDGTFTERVFEEDKYKWFPVLKKDGKPGPIKGRLDLSVNFTRARFTKPTTVKFSVSIMDRAGHRSNTVETDTTTVYLF